MVQEKTRPISRDEQVAVHALALLGEHMPDPLRDYIKKLASDPAFNQHFYFASWGKPSGFLVDWFNASHTSSDPSYAKRCEALADIELYGYESDDYREGMPSTGLWDKCFDARVAGWVRMLAETVVSERTMSDDEHDYSEAYEAGTRSPEIDAALGRVVQSTHPAGARNAHLTELLVELPLRLLEIQANRQTEYFRRYDMRSWHDIVEEYAHS